MTGDPLPIFMECGCHIAPFGGCDMNCFSIAHKIIYLVRQAENLIIIGAHTLGHYFLIDANHVPMANIEFPYKKWKQWDTEFNFALFGSCNIVTDCWPALKQIIAQFVGKGSEGACAIMLQETYGHIGLTIKGSYCYLTVYFFNI